MTNGPVPADEPNSAAHIRKLYDQAAVLARIGAWECDLASQRLTWTDGVYDLFGFRRGSELRRSATVELYHDESRRQMERLRAALIAQGRSFTMDARICTAAGEARWMRLSAGVAHEHGRPVRIFGAKQDITHEKELWDRLRQFAEQDALTGLSNRRVFEARCAELSRHCGHDGAVAALALVDLDDFKQINDRFGHSAGDECLRQVASRLARVFPDATVIARMGGDEFAVLLRAPGGGVAASLERARRVLGRPVQWHAGPIPLGVSIGATVIDRPQRFSPSQMFAEADSALYVAKAAGRNAVRLFGEAFAAGPAAGMPRRAAG